MQSVRTRALRFRASPTGPPAVAEPHVSTALCSGSRGASTSKPTGTGSSPASRQPAPQERHTSPRQEGDDGGDAMPSRVPSLAPELAAASPQPSPRSAGHRCPLPPPRCHRQAWALRDRVTPVRDADAATRCFTDLPLNTTSPTTKLCLRPEPRTFFCRSS